DLRLMREELVLDEISRRLDDHALFFAESEIHGRQLPMWKVSERPSTAMAWPVTIFAAGEARKRHISAISSGFTKRLIDWAWTYSLKTTSGETPRLSASAFITRSIRGPSTEPGQIALARTS